jgi:hypothetical protein
LAIWFWPAEHEKKIKLSKINDILDAILPIYPVILVVIATPLLIHFGQQWLGFILGGLLILLFFTWDTCILGLLNVISILGMFIVCAVPYLKS